MLKISFVFSISQTFYDFLVIFFWLFVVWMTKISHFSHSLHCDSNISCMKFWNSSDISYNTGLQPRATSKSTAGMTFSCIETTRKQVVVLQKQKATVVQFPSTWNQPLNTRFTDDCDTAAKLATSSALSWWDASVVTFRQKKVWERKKQVMEFILNSCISGLAELKRSENAMLLLLSRQ